MADLIIKPATGDGNKLILQDKAGGAVLTTADSGATIASGVVSGMTGIPAAGVTGTLVNATQDNITRLGTVTSGTLEDAVTYRNINQDLATTDNPTFANQPICVYAGWNSSTNSTTGSSTAYTLDVTYKAVNTTYLTKSTNTFTCVKAGNYQVNLNTMSYIQEGDYVHHRIRKNGVHFFQTHSYGTHSGLDKWNDYRYCLNIDLAVGNTIAFDAYTNSGTYLWHDNASYSQLNIIFLHS